MQPRRACRPSSKQSSATSNLASLTAATSGACAEIPVEPLRAARWPKLVIGGTWECAPALYRERGALPARRAPGLVNSALREIFGVGVRACA